MSFEEFERLMEFLKNHHESMGQTITISITKRKPPTAEVVIDGAKYIITGTPSGLDIRDA